LSESVIDLLLQTVDSLTVQIEDIPNGVQEDESILLMFSDLYAEFLDEADADGGGSQALTAPRGAGHARESKERRNRTFCPTTDDDAFDDHELLESYDPAARIRDPRLTWTTSPPAVEERSGRRAAADQRCPDRPAGRPHRAAPASPGWPGSTPANQNGRRIQTPQRSMISAGEKKFVKVGVEGLDSLMNLVGQLVINRTRLDQRITYLNRMSVRHELQPRPAC
jgi:hypothetical protein